MNWLCLRVPDGQSNGLGELTADGAWAYEPIANKPEELNEVRRLLHAKIEAKYFSRGCVRNRIVNSFNPLS